MCERIKVLQREISELENDLVRKRLELEQIENEIACDQFVRQHWKLGGELSSREISRYSRQMLLRNFGLDAQLTLKKARVCVVGIGGLGCPVSMFLASSGIGHLVLIDADKIERTNLARQILFDEYAIGEYKCEKAKKVLNKLNPFVQISAIVDRVHETNVDRLLTAFGKFDVIVDCTDNVLSRYVLNDSCARLRIPLVFGSALKWEGQLSVYNYENGPCYRCVFPVAPSAHLVTDCADSGVIAPITGCIGNLQALEVLKVLTRSPHVLAGRMLIVDGEYGIFRTISLRKKDENCLVCGKRAPNANTIDYSQMCINSSASQLNRIEFDQFYEKLCKNEPMVVIDVRTRLEFDLYRLQNSRLLEMDELGDSSKLVEIERIASECDRKDNLFVICRRGNDSRIAVDRLNSRLPGLCFRDVVRGINAFHDLHPTVPMF